MNKQEYRARCEKMNNAIVQWMLTKNPSNFRIDTVMNRAQAIQTYWMYQVTDWDSIDLLAFSLMGNK